MMFKRYQSENAPAELEEEELRLRGDRCGVVVSPRRGHPPEFASRARHEARAVHRARQAEYVAAQGEDDAVLETPSSVSLQELRPLSWRTEPEDSELRPGIQESGSVPDSVL